MLGYFDLGDVLFALYNALCSAFDVAQVTMPLEVTNNEIHCAKQKAVFNGDLPQPLLPGHCIEVTGAVLTDCERFAINFLCGEGEQADIAFHFNPRLTENYIVRNSRHRGKWGAEETAGHRRLELPRNYNFCLSFFIADKEFFVAIDNKHFCSFVYRVPMTSVRGLEILGDVSVDDVAVKEYSSYPTVPYVNVNKPVPFKDIYDAKSELPNPFIGHLESGFQNGWQLEIHGKVKLLPHSFYVNLQEGNYLWPHPIIPLHLNPRFNTTVHAHTLIRNTWQNGSWGEEERSPGFHFVPSKPFRLVIQLDTNHEVFIVWVNDQLEGEFRIRNAYSVQNIDTLFIQGDLVIYKVFMRSTFTNVLEEKKKHHLTMKMHQSRYT